jgi:hypothetical protein
MRHAKIITTKYYNRNIKRTKQAQATLAKQHNQPTNQPGHRQQAARTRNEHNTQAAA